ncbi:putative transmembrane protein [Escherichia coli]|uniref:Putative transmembrane protein n=1 Tax=Escherichia coli TaxID=562 RepID=A0A376UDC3_ECOLX|nr:putative transmembrane protein [Escherichia coli]
MLHRIGILPVVQKVVSGAEVDDPDLHENIRICYPYGIMSTIILSMLKRKLIH